MNKVLFKKKAACFFIPVLFIILFAFAGCTKENKNIVAENTGVEVPAGKALLILEDEVNDIMCLVQGEGVYLPLSLVKELFNSNFYWDEAEDVLSYVLPGEIRRFYPGEAYYHIDKGVKGLDVPALVIENNQAYVSSEIVQMLSDIHMFYYENPNRLVVNYRWNEYLEYKVLEDDTYVHLNPDLTEASFRVLKTDDKVRYISGTGKSPKDFVKIMTEDGLYGYVQLKHLSESYYNQKTSTYVEPVWEHILLSEAVKLGWHQISSAAGNSTFENATSKADGMNVISPTWFRLSSVEGDIESIADADYVRKAHEAGYAVWPLLDNFAEGVSTLQPMSSTKTREKIIDKLIEETLLVGADGINIDFEAISRETGVHFVQFIKELSVKAHKFNLIVSVDNYVPSSYRAYYDLESQGKFADYVILMAYDEHYAGSQEAGSVSSIGYVQNAITDCLKMVNKENIVVALPFYTRIWMEAKSGVTSEARSMNGADNFIRENGLKTKWDAETGQNYAECVLSGVTYRVWLEDIQSLSVKLQAVVNGNIGGTAFWRLGQEADGVWDIINQYIK